jgi:quinol monooxygenase YgiN
VPAPVRRGDPASSWDEFVARIRRWPQTSEILVSNLGGGMVVEYIRYNIDNARAEGFAAAYRQAAEALDASEHCQRYEVSRCAEDPTQHIVRIEWDSEDGHLAGFRSSPEFRDFFNAVGPFVNDIEEMRHYEVTLASGG